MNDRIRQDFTLENTSRNFNYTTRPPETDPMGLRWTEQANHGVVCWRYRGYLIVMCEQEWIAVELSPEQWKKKIKAQGEIELRRKIKKRLQT